VSRDKKTVIKTTLNVPNETLNEKYLGMPSDVGNSKNGSFKYLKDRICKKIQGWLDQLLAPGGKEVLIKVVALDIPIFSMLVLNYQGGCVRRSTRCCAASVGGAKMENVRPVGCRGRLCVQLSFAASWVSEMWSYSILQCPHVRALTHVMNNWLSREWCADTSQTYL
jgi:hypothetical protein